MWTQQDEYDRDESRVAGIVRLGIVIVVALALCGLVWTAVNDASKHGRQVIRSVTRVQILPQAPVAQRPPPPQKIEQAPKMQERFATEQGAPQQTIKQPDQLLPLTAEEGSGANPYGLRPGTGGGDIVASMAAPAPAGRTGIDFMAYGRAVAQQVQAAVQRDAKLRYGRFVVELRVWVDAAGRITQVRVTTPSGDAATDAALAQALTGLVVAPPSRDMPQPIRLRVRAEPA